MAKPIYPLLAVMGFSCFTACASSQGKPNQSGDGGGAGTGGKASGGTNMNSPPMPMEVPPRSAPGSCGLENPAFCETFEKKHPEGRAGDLDESLWSFSRWGHEWTQYFVRVPASQETGRAIGSVFCGGSFADRLMPNDVAICDGVGVDGLTSAQLNEVFDDQEDFAFNSMRSRQLFDFTNRTGTVVFDVDAKVNPLNVGHGWWVEFWITEDSAPMPYHEAPGVVSYPRNGLGIDFRGLNDCPQGRTATTVARVFVTKDHEILHDYPGWELEHDSDEARCIKTEDQKLNRFKIMVSKDKLEIWASHFDDGENLHRIVTAPMLDLPFTRGYIHLQHSAYNAPKDGNVTAVQTYRWDNIGFDGPSYAVPRSYTVADNDVPDTDGRGGYMYGYVFKGADWVSLTVPGVDLDKAASAVLDFNTLIYGPRTLQYRLNGGGMHTFEMRDFGRPGLRTFSVGLPLNELKAGDNTLEVKLASAEAAGLPEYIGQVEVSISEGK